MSRLYGIGVGPGDPELMTLKAARLIAASPVVAYFAKRGGLGHARRIAADHVRPDHVEVPLIYPITTEAPPAHMSYDDVIQAFYDRSAEELATHLADGRSVAVICEGDPFFYGSFMYLFTRLADRFDTEIVPGISSIMACAAELRAPLTYRNDVLAVIPGTLDDAELRLRLASIDAAAIMKLGRNFTKVRTVLADLGLLDRARYIERATMGHQRILPLAEVDPATVPYFSMIVVPSINAVPTRHTAPIPQAAQ